MAKVYSKRLLSGSTNGLGIKVTPTATPGVLIHTAVAGTDAFDEIWLWAVNLDGSARTITIEWGGVTDPDHLYSKGYSIPANSGLILVVPGLLLQNSLVVRVFASVTNIINITGYVNRIEEA